jgi:hypothetical protein
MKKLIIAAAFILLAGVAFGQSLQKGSVLGLHVISVNLDPDVTFNQWENFGLTKFIPAINKEFQGDIELYYAKVDRGDDENGLSLIWLFKSAEVRAKYFTQEGDGTELFNSKYEKILQSLAEEMSKIGTSTYSRVHYNDWIIQ